ncbi:chalcone isomerase family protein [Pelomonas cellulosilytica]|uniref:Chalcone isomerase family protein n=1 Tax=Pelomonas cellulosilytica TaxID=2906762 RepID=A0ABS8XX47_9BURK|nr:chalcone isomerase family protein [Pelomonas sp. P8]MCE4555268.1 chalcone isomerase family protein [Pelomonas sp. P8]
MSLLRRALLLTVVAGLATPAFALRYEGQDFADTLPLGGSTLQLNGVGAKVFVMRYSAYVAALYLPQKAGTAEAVYAQTGPKRVELRITIPLVKDVSTQEFVKAINKGVSRNSTEAEKAALEERLKQFNAAITEVGRVKKGDVLVIDYLPAQGGTVLTVNGKVWGKPVEGHDFYTAFLKVFIGDHNSDGKLRAGLLGQPAQPG